jgi:hypothetical protein
VKTMGIVVVATFAASAGMLPPVETDDQFKLGGLNYRKIGGLLALKNATGVDTGLMICVRNASSVAHSPPAAVNSRS